MKGLQFEATPFGPPPPASFAEIGAARQRLAEPLRAAFLATGAAEAELDRLVSGAWCVTTGQQPGLLTGPLFTIYKALSAVALARRCEVALGRPVVPVFWVAGDDHDFAEANHLHLLTTDNRVERVVLRERPAEAPLTPLYREPVGQEIDRVFSAITAHTPASEFRPEVLEWLERHYHPSADLAGAFAGAMAELLGPFGLVIFRSTHPAAKRAMAPLLLRTLEVSTDLDSRLAEQAAELRSHGAEVPVQVGEGATPVLLEARLGRDRLLSTAQGMVTRRSAEHFSLDDLRRLSDEDPARMSPNVLLRPVLEAAILPTLAYLGGPGELRYLPQCEPLYEALGVVPQAPIPRWSGRAVEGRIRKVLDKYHVTSDDLVTPQGQLERTLLRDDLPAAAQDALASLRDVVAREHDRLREAAAAVDPTLRQPVESARNEALKGTDDIEKRIVGHLKQQNDILVQQLAKARANLFPLGQPQERVLATIPFLVRYGHGFLDAARAEAETAMATLEPAPAGP